MHKIDCFKTATQSTAAQRQVSLQVKQTAALLPPIATMIRDYLYMREIEKIKRLLEEGNLSRGEAELLKLVRIDPDNKTAWLYLAAIFSRSERYDELVEPYKNLVRISPRAAFPSSGLAATYFQLGLLDETLCEIERFKNLAEKQGEDVEKVLAEHDRLKVQISEIRSNEQD